MSSRKPKKNAPKRRNGVAKALRSPAFRQRVKPAKHRRVVLDAFSGSVMRALFEVERF